MSTADGREAGGRASMQIHTEEKKVLCTEFLFTKLVLLSMRWWSDATPLPASVSDQLLDMAVGSFVSGAYVGQILLIHG